MSMVQQAWIVTSEENRKIESTWSKHVAKLHLIMQPASDTYALRQWAIEKS